MVDRALDAFVVNGKWAAPEKICCDGLRQDGSRTTGGDVQPYSMACTVRVLIAYENQLGEASKEYPASVTTGTLLPQSTGTRKNCGAGRLFDARGTAP